MFKIIHTADLGIREYPYGGINPATGLNRRFEDVYRTLMFIVNKTIKNKCKYILLVGDINEDRNPESLLIEKFAKQIRKLIDNDVRIILIAGNHDIDGPKGTSTSISYLKELKLPNLYIADTKIESMYFEDDDITFHCYPYLAKGQLGIDDNEGMSNYINNSISEVNFESKYNVLVSHYSTEKTFEGLYVDEIKLNIDVMKRFDYVALGHIHKYEMFDNLGVNGGYSGSIYKKDFGENHDKFINLVDFNESCNFEKIQLPVRDFLEFYIDATESSHDEFYDFIFENLQGQVKDKIIKIKIKVNERFNAKPIYDFLRKEESFHFLPVIWEKGRKERTFKIKDSTKMNNTQILKERLKSLNIDKKFEKKIFTFCEEIIKDYG